MSTIWIRTFFNFVYIVSSISFRTYSCSSFFICMFMFWNIWSCFFISTASTCWYILVTNYCFRSKCTCYISRYCISYNISTWTFFGFDFVMCSIVIWYDWGTYAYIIMCMSWFVWNSLSIWVSTTSCLTCISLSYITIRFCFRICKFKVTVFFFWRY